MNVPNPTLGTIHVPNPTTVLEVFMVALLALGDAMNLLEIILIKFEIVRQDLVGKDGILSDGTAKFAKRCLSSSVPTLSEARHS